MAMGVEWVWHVRQTSAGVVLNSLQIRILRRAPQFESAFHQNQRNTQIGDQESDDDAERQEIRSVAAGQARVEFGEVRYRRTKVSSDVLSGGEQNVSRQSLVDTRERIRCCALFSSQISLNMFLPIGASAACITYD